MIAMWLPSDQNGELELTDIVDLFITIYVVITYYAPTQSVVECCHHDSSVISKICNCLSCDHPRSMADMASYLQCPRMLHTQHMLCITHVNTHITHLHVRNFIIGMHRQNKLYMYTVHLYNIATAAILL